VFPGLSAKPPGFIVIIGWPRPQNGGAVICEHNIEQRVEGLGAAFLREVGDEFASQAFIRG
jgi:hypothetical protein